MCRSQFVVERRWSAGGASAAPAAPSSSRTGVQRALSWPTRQDKTATNRLVVSEQRRKIGRNERDAKAILHGPRGVRREFAICFWQHVFQNTMSTSCEGLVSGYYCFRCGRTNPTDFCPHCAAADEEFAAEQRQNDLIRSQEEALHKRQNPGDYDCPHCLYRTLKLSASRCPMCHGQIGVEFWRPIIEERKRREARAERERQEQTAQAAARRRREADEAEQRRIEWEKAAPEREARSKQAAFIQAKHEYKKEQRENWRIVWRGVKCASFVGFCLGMCFMIGGWLFSISGGGSSFSPFNYGLKAAAIVAGPILLVAVVVFAVRTSRTKSKWRAKLADCTA